MQYEVQVMFEAYEHLQKLKTQEENSTDADSLAEQRREQEQRLNRTFKKAVKAALFE